MIRKLLALLMLLTLMLTAGCGSSSEDATPKETPIAKPLSDDASDCANIVKLLLDQQLNYNNGAAETLLHKAELSVHNNPFPLNENFGRYSKTALQENLRGRFMTCSRFDDVTPSGKTVELDGEYQELKVHIEYPDIVRICVRRPLDAFADARSACGV